MVDAYDAMTSDRPYRPGMSHEQAMSVLQRFAGTQFDPSVVQVFTSIAGTVGSRRQATPEGTAEDSLHSLFDAVRLHSVPQPDDRRIMSRASPSSSPGS